VNHRIYLPGRCTLTTVQVDLNLRKQIVKCYILSTDFYGYFLLGYFGKYEGKSIIKLQIVIEKKLMWIMTYKQHLFFNVISKQI